jgi:hypothetical protein
MSCKRQVILKPRTVLEASTELRDWAHPGKSSSKEQRRFQMELDRKPTFPISQGKKTEEEKPM